MLQCSRRRSLFSSHTRSQSRSSTFPATCTSQAVRFAAVTLVKIGHEQYVLFASRE